MQNALVKTTPQSLQKLSRALAITEKLLEDDNPLGLPELIPYRKGDKWGFCNRKKEIVIACEYDWVKMFDNCIAIVFMSNWCFVINRNGKRIAVNYNPIIKSIHFGAAAKWNDSTIMFQDYPSSREGLLLVWEEENDKYGFINENEDIVVPIVYDDAISFYGGFSFAEKSGKWGLINNKGVEITDFIFDYNPFNLYYYFSDFPYYKYFFEELLPVRKNGKYGFIDKLGNEIIPFIYDQVYWFSEGLAAIKKEGKYGYIDKLGNVIIPFIYEFTWKFSEGLADVEKEGKYGYIDKLGNVIIPFIYEFADSFSEGLAAVKKEGKYGFIDKLGNLIIPFIHDSADFFSEGRALVKKEGKYSFIDKNGKLIIPNIYDNAYSYFDNGLVRVERNSKFFFINKEGTEYYEE